MGRVVGVDIGGTKTAVWVWDAEKECPVGEQRFPTRCEAGPDAVLAEVSSQVRALLKGTATPSHALLALGIAVPGRVDAAGTVLDGGRLLGWRDLQLKDRLQRALAVPVFVEQDANAAALGEQWCGSAKHLRDFVFLALGTGVGAGLVLGGMLHRGSHCAAGEVGDLVPDRHRLGQGHPGGHRVSSVVGGAVIRDRAQKALGHRMGTAEALRYAHGDRGFAPLQMRFLTMWL